jgi:indole-3-glycerol phosphate synthase
MGASLNELLDACTCLGTEALVEVHTVAELEKALELGATNIVATNWDRIENALYPDQAKGLKGLIPDLIVAIGAGGVGTVQDAAELADMGYDAVVLGRGLAASADIERLISTIRSRESLPNLLTGAGMMAEELKRGGGE